MENTIVPCLWLDDQAEAAAAFYCEVFGGHVLSRSYFPSDAPNRASKPPGSVVTVDFSVLDQRFTLVNGGPLFKINPTISFFVHGESVAECTRIFGHLANGGMVFMAQGSYPWSPCYGWVQDRYGVSWQVILKAEDGCAIVPCLMFSGKMHGKAKAALESYVAIFAGAPDDTGASATRIKRIEPYLPGEQGVGTKHARFYLGNSEMIVMDSHIDHGVAFNEGVSLQVLAADQPSVDYFWDHLAKGGSPGPCGWLTDPFGVAWQVAPVALRDRLASGDVAARDRAFAAVMKTKKLDLAAIEAAFEGAE